MKRHATNFPALTLHTVKLTTPFLAASGTYGWGDGLPDFSPGALPGAIVTPTITLHPRAGSPMPRTAEATAGLLHAAGLPNPGIAQFLTDKMPHLVQIDCPIVVSIWGATLDEWQGLARELRGVSGVAALELNLLPAQFFESDAVRTDTQTIQSQTLDTISAVRGAWSGTLVAKLPPIGLGIGAFARQAEACGADVLALNQGFPGYMVKAASGAAKLANGAGILSGPCIKPLALYQVYEAAQSVSCPIIGGGGVMTLEDASEFFAAGAMAVTVGIATLIHPSAIAKLIQEWRAAIETA